MNALPFASRFPRSALALAAALAIAFTVSGCAVGPRYEQPTTALPSNWKELQTAEGWLPAAPADALDRGEWWKLFNDATLDDLAGRVQVSNQNIAAAVANYSQAQALVRGERAALFPSVSLDGSGKRTGTVGGGGTSGSSPSNAFSATLGASWTPDVWGRLREAVSSAQANAQASEADLAAARLSAIGDLAINYFSLREADAEMVLLDETIQGYQRAFDITSNRYAAGIAAQTDVLQAQTQLVNAKADRVGLQRSRATYEHAIATLLGVAPADFSLPAAQWTPSVPGVPTGVPSTLLQRRPDIAAAERTVASANSQIGIARAAYFPNINLTASVGSNASRVKDLFSSANSLWSLGFSVAQVVFDAGAIAANVDSAKAGYESSVARYRQTVLTAFQAVEDQLTASATLAQQEGLRREASAAADKTEQQLLNRYRAGQVSYTDVVTAQAAALSARRTLVQLQVNRQTTAIALVQAMGGGWQAGWMGGSANTQQTDPATTPRAQ
ncbi:efflux transporter outer membrane subunit [Variovorax sp. J22G73]|jgi:NodT family efflux transporter outer membrane factor (OMF) lipoprotein|uniref:efflux transporter outer membrane subunit n=1 Tax=unclassified Variovorax TaxID=663243 RepID=UPI000D5C9130|nr:MULTISPECIES: efflux transporter outer membrane subunit [unclassified Variovorax]MDM0009684.1 efflux transporter outer membrane subunit [Variovorax sp. J22R203]MDM0102192.1 efflux transporter outer membrane subunit [Variovorax sp. J22G73]